MNVDSTTSFSPPGSRGSALLEALVALTLLAALMGSLLAGWSRFERTVRQASVDRGVLESAEMAMEITWSLSSERLVARLRDEDGLWVRKEMASEAHGPWVDAMSNDEEMGFVRRVTLRARTIVDDRVTDAGSGDLPSLVEIEVVVEAVRGTLPTRLTLRRLRVL